jgi:hypothetical protein
MIDLEMLVVTEDGRERSAAELRRLMTDAGMRADDVRITAPGTAVLFASA